MTVDHGYDSDKHSMNEAILYTLAGLGMSFAGFSGLVVTLPTRRDARAWSPAELRMLGLLIGDSFVVLFLALLPVPMALADWPVDTIWTLCSALLGSWCLLGGLMTLRGELRDRKGRHSIANPVMAPVRYGIYLVAFAMGAILWLSIWDLLLANGQPLYVLGLLVLLAFAAVEFLFFIGLVLQQGQKE